MLLHKTKDTIKYKSKMEKRLGITLKQNYINKITIPTGNSDIIYRFPLDSRKQGKEKRFGLGKTKAGMVTASSAAK